MGGAACAVGAIIGAAKLNLPCNIIALTPLCENMPSGYLLLPFLSVFSLKHQRHRMFVNVLINLCISPATSCFYDILCIHLPE